MSQDQNQPQPDVTSTTTAPAAQSAAPTITPEILAMIEAARVEGRNSGAAETRRAMEGKVRAQAPNATQAQPAAPQPSAPPASAVDHMALRAFDRSLGKFDLTDDAMAVVEEDFARANPPDPVAWVAARANAYGWRPRGAQATATTTNVTNPAPASPAHPATAMLGTTPPVAVTSDTPLTSLGKTDLDAAIRRLGPHEFSRRWMSELASSGKRIPIR
jgi:hypothetical protein